MNQKGSLLLYLALGIMIISIIGGLYIATMYQRFQTDEKLDEQKRQELEKKVKQNFVPDLQSMEE